MSTRYMRCGVTRSRSNRRLRLKSRANDASYNQMDLPVS